MAREDKFYICPICFQVCESKKACDLHIHAHRMVAAHPGEPGDLRRKPLQDRYGNLLSRAPRWFMEAIGRINSSNE